MSKFAPWTLGDKTISVRLIDVMKGFVGSLPVFWVHSFVDIANDFFVPFHEVYVFARFVLP